MSIESKLKEWLDKHEDGKRVQNAKIAALKKSGSNSEAMQLARQYADELRSDLINKYLPRSLTDIMETIDAIGYEEIIISEPVVLPNGDIKIELTFDPEAVRRWSLWPEKYGAVVNIVALLNVGYKAKDYVYGEWQYQKIRSKKERAGGWFMQAAVEDFNAAHEGKCVAQLSDYYKRG